MDRIREAWLLIRGGPLREFSINRRVAGSIPSVERPKITDAKYRW